MLLLKFPQLEKKKCTFNQHIFALIFEIDLLWYIYRMCAQNRLAIACDLQIICKVKHFSNKKFKICIKLFKNITILWQVSEAVEELFGLLQEVAEFVDDFSFFFGHHTCYIYMKKNINRGNTRSVTGFFFTMGYKYTIVSTLYNFKQYLSSTLF